MVVSEKIESVREGAGAAPDPEVDAKGKRRRFSSQFKLKILTETDRCRRPGEVGAVLRRDGLYSSLLSVWRRERERGELNLRGKKRGRHPLEQNPLAGKVAELEREVQRLQERLRKADLVIEFQKKVCELLEIPIKPSEKD